MTETTTAIAVRDSSAILPAMSMGEAVHRYNALVQFTQSIMKPTKDFGVIPGTPKPTLLKPGAEKLCSFFGLSLDYELSDRVMDWQNGFFHFEYKAVLTRNGALVATGIGSCNSKEKKYRYRASERKCPSCGKPTIIKGKSEYGGGYICFAKKGGCGAKFHDGDKAIESQPAGQVENTEPFDLVNTLQKMAQKRALVAAVLVACNASEFFTQDVEDMELIEGWGEVSPSHAPVIEVEAKPAPTNGKPQTPAIPDTTGVGEITDGQLTMACRAYMTRNKVDAAEVRAVVLSVGGAERVAAVPPAKRPALLEALNRTLAEVPQ